VTAAVIAFITSKGETMNSPNENDINSLKNTALEKRGSAALVEVEQQRAIQEVQAALTIAQRFPRDQIAAFNRIIDACRRPALAEQGMYEYAKGGSKVRGPSIRLAEMMVQSWGNVQTGWRELSRQDGVSEVSAWAWDLETNSKTSIEFNVRHWRDTRTGGYQVTEERDIYELMANMASRRLRACILRVIPGDIQEAAVKECEKTLGTATGEPLRDRLRKMVVAFRDLGVSKEAIEKRLTHPLDATGETEFVQLRGIYASIKDGMADRSQFFDLSGGNGDKKPPKGGEKSIATQWPAQHESGNWIDSAGEFWNGNIHAGDGANPPPVKQDGTFRARRGTAGQAPAEDDGATQAEEQEPPADESEDPGAGLE
jgi:hypothetical protein